MKTSALIALFGMGVAAAAQSAERPRPVKDDPRVVHGVQVGRPMPAVSLDVDLRDLPIAPEWEPGDPIKEVPQRTPPPEITPPPITRRIPDLLLNRQLSPALPNSRAFEVPVIHFDAQNYASSTPPDTVGDVGPNHYVQAVNASGGARLAVYDKATGLLIGGPVLLSALGAPSPCNVGFGDPVVLYDAMADRWLLAEFPMGGNHMCFYVSKTPDPVSGGWWFYHLGPLANFPDYPKLAVWPDAYYMTTNEGNAPPAWALDRTNMLTGATARPAQRFTPPGLPGFGFESLTPADLDGAMLPPPGAPAIFARHRDDEVHDPPGTGSDFIELWAFHVDFNTPANSTLTTLPRVAISDYSSELCGFGLTPCVPQPGTTTRLDTIMQVIMNRLQYRNFGTYEALVGDFTVDADGEPDNPPNLEREGVRWFELRKTGADWTLFQEGTHSPNDDPRWMGAIAQDKDGNMALGYSVSNDVTSIFYSLRYTGREASDPPGTMRQEVELATGAAFHVSNRNGDYANMSVDPVDDCTFWFTSMYIPINTPANRWRTHIGAFRFDSCGNAIPANTAVFDPALQAPSCLATGRSCDSLATLVGRDTITGGAETNQPNTLGGSCADGTAGIFHVRESIDRIKVQTLDGTALAAGKTVRVDVTVWGWSRAFTDTLEVFFTANATSPSWTRAGAVRVTRPGAQTLSMTYTLPAGPLQAVRARFRYLGDNGSCGAGPYNDHDDLAFAVQ